MLTIRYHSTFKKDYKRILKRGYDISKLTEVINLLVNNKALPARFRDHELIGEYKGCRECHITPNWLLIYEIANNELLLLLTRTGSHSNLFK